MVVSLYSMARECQLYTWHLVFKNRLSEVYSCVVPVSAPAFGAKEGRVGLLLDGVADMMTKRWIGSELVHRGKYTESKTTRHEGYKRHNVLGWLHASRGLLEESSGMHAWTVLMERSRWVNVVCCGNKG